MVDIPRVHELFILLDADAFTVLSAAGIILLVHGYAKLDGALIRKSLRENLGDFTEFREAVARFVAL